MDEPAIVPALPISDSPEQRFSIPAAVVSALPVSNLPEQLLSIPGCTLHQILPTENVSIATGTLAISEADENLLLELPPVIFPLSTDTSVRTHRSDETKYRFTIPLHSLTKGSPATDEKADILLTLPADVEPAVADRFEGLLVEHGFLTTGLVADADDAVGWIQSAAARVVDAVGGYAKHRVESREQVELGEELHPSDTAKKVSAGVRDGTGAAADATGTVVGAISNFTKKAGEWVGERVSFGETAREAVEAGDALGTGITEASKGATGAVGDSMATVVEHEKGTEAKKVVDEGRETMGNVGQVGMDVAVGTSVPWQAAVAGARVADPNPEGTEGTKHA